MPIGEGIMNDTSIKQQVVDYLTANFLFDSAKQIPENDSLLETGIIDSTGVLELIGFIEKNYGIKVQDEELVPENLDTINSISRFIREKLDQKKQAAAV